MPLSVMNVLSRVSYMKSYVRTYVSELRSLPHRIRLLSQKTSAGRLPLDLGPMYEETPNGEFVPCKATHARMQYIEFVLARYPWATAADLLLALDGWDKGTESQSHTSDTSNMGEGMASVDQYPLALV